MFHLVRGNAYLLLLVHRSCDHVYIHLCLSLMMYVFFTYPYMCYFTQRCLDEFCFKVFQKYRLSKSTCHKLSSCKVFQEFVLG